MKWLSNVLYVFSALMLAMGAHGAAKSMVSLVAGVVIALLCGFGAWYGMTKPKVGYGIATVGCLLPLAQFGQSMAKKGFVLYPAFTGFALAAVALACCIAGHFMYSARKAS